MKYILYILFFISTCSYGQAGSPLLLLPPCNTPATITLTTNINVGSTATATNAMAGGKWASSNNAVGTIGSINGIVGGVSGGTISISYTVCASAPSAIATLTVNAAAGTTFDPANKGTNIVLSSGNLTYTISPNDNAFARSTTSHIIVGGGSAYTFETKSISGGGNVEPIGIVASTISNYNQEPAFIAGTGTTYVYYNFGQIYANRTAVQSGLANYTTTDNEECVVDCNAGSVKFYKNGAQVGTTITGLTGTWYMMGGGASGASVSGSVIFITGSMVNPIAGASGW